VPVIGVFVKPGDSVKAEDSLVTLQSDEATMDAHPPQAPLKTRVKLATR
jgi:pyruvate dehydrogenase E2 component (dihydrolipoamide acetyltransferase)